jgi:hypothetical protein
MAGLVLPVWAELHLGAVIWRLVVVFGVFVAYHLIMGPLPLRQMAPLFVLLLLSVVVRVLGNWSRQ